MAGNASMGGLRRALVALVIVFTCVFTYMYWHQMRNTPNEKAPTFQRHQDEQAPSDETNHPWTWACMNNHCERRENTGSNMGVSLATCNMLCGSTQLWPQPTGVITLGSVSYAFDPKQLELALEAPSQVVAMARDAFALFKQNVQSGVEKNYTLPSDVNSFIVSITLTDPGTHLYLATNEGYKLQLHRASSNEKGSEQVDLVAAITAANFFGARHALETLSQLTWWDDRTRTLRILKGVMISDKPKFAYRGLMVDTSRNFFSVKALKRTLDGMAAVKLNVFHWHISDSQSFPFEAPSLPQMAEHGAYDSRHVYREKDVKEIVAYAKVRGIRVVIEVDTPAHAGMGWTWGPSKGLGDLAVCVGQQPWSLYCGEPPCGQLNPYNPHVYSVLQSLYSDILHLTGERELFHIGGDEVNLECWAQHRAPTTTSTTRSKNVTIDSDLSWHDLHDVWGNFTLKALDSLKRANGNKHSPSHVIVWSSNLTKRPYLRKYLDMNKIVVQVWGPKAWMEASSLMDSGYRVVLSHVDAWYLDCGFGKWRETGDSACDPYRTWQTVYSHRPWTSIRLQTKHRTALDYIIGGEACLWSEQVSEDVLDSRLWPRTAAFAERMWSDIEAPDGANTGAIPEDTYTRLDTLRSRLLKRGLRPDVLWPEWCSHNPGMCL